MISNLTWLVLNIFFESRGEAPAGQVAVGHVTLNRVAKHGTSIEEVVRKPYQFSWLNEPEQVSIEVKHVPELIQCVKSALTCWSERTQGKDLFKADHYFADYIEPPKWSKDMEFIGKIGRHMFYRE